MSTSTLALDLPHSSSAVFSNDRRYRYSLTRSWDAGPRLNFVMLNPSTADEETNDPTIERCVRRAKSYGYGSLVVTNLFAYRSTNPGELKLVEDPVGGWNDDALLRQARASDAVVCAWGVDGRLLNRDRQVKSLFKRAGIRLYVLKLSRDGYPCHPLYLPYSLKPVAWWPVYPLCLETRS